MNRERLRLVARTFGPHLLVGPLVLAWRCSADWPPPPVLWWAPHAAAAAALVGLPGVWVASSLAVGRRLAPVPIPAGTWSGIRAWWQSEFTPRPRRPGDEFTGCLELLLLCVVVVFGALAYAFLIHLWRSPAWLAAVCQLVDLGLLAAALRRARAFAALRERADATARAQETQADRAAALHAVESYYAEHAALIANEYPPVRLHTELRVRVPASAGPDEVWSIARSLLTELHEIVRESRRQREKDLVTALPGTPARDLAVELRVRISHLEAQIAQTDGEITRSRDRGENPAWLERQLAGLQLRRKEAVAELERLVPI